MEEKLQHILESYKIEQGTLIGVLQDMQEAYGYLPEERLEDVSYELNVPLSRLFSLATFYTSFRLEPMGKHHICACVGTACHVRGAPTIVDTIERELHVARGGTTEDRKFTLDTVNCVGACALAPLIMIDGEHHGKMTQNKIKRLLKSYEERKE
jgi:NADH-quinone oxidoreductase subunit E